MTPSRGVSPQNARNRGGRGHLDHDGRVAEVHAGLVADVREGGPQDVPLAPQPLPDVGAPQQLPHDQRPERQRRQQEQQGCTEPIRAQFRTLSIHGVGAAGGFRV